MIGETILNYRVQFELGSGGLGTVYAAEHALIGRRAALKVLSPAVAHDEAMVARFLAEARAVNAIRHPNIVDVTDYGQANGHFFIVMELLEGETLGQRLEKVGRLEVRPAQAALLQVASAVGAAHQRGIVHRDLKPENIFLTAYADYPDFVKVLDFGIAKLMHTEASGLKTSPGLIMGTPAYMSPEQCLGASDLDHRSDIYSLGVVAYRMLTGSLPFLGNAMQMMHGHLTQTAAPPRSLEPRIPEALERLVVACMQRHADQRPQSMQEVRDALAHLGARSPLAFSEEELPGHQKTHLRVAPPPPPSPQPTPRPSPSVRPPVEPPVARAPATSPPAPAWGLVRPSVARQTSLLQARAEATDALSRMADTVRDDLHDRTQAVAVAAKMREIIHKRLQADALQLPAMPVVAIECLQKSHDPEVSFAALAQIIEKDPFIASRVVRLSNSPAFSGLARITTIDGAVARLGMMTLTALLQELAAEQVFTSRDPTIRNAFRGIWEHCLGVGHLARHLAGVVRGADPNTAYMAGLFHDIGKPVVAALLLEAERSTPEGKQWLSGGVWRRVVDECHRDVGAIIAYRWYLPREVAAAVADLESYDLKRGRQSCVNVVRLANALCQREGLDVKAAHGEELARVILQGRQLLGLSDEQLLEATQGLVRRVHGITSENEEADNSTRVFDRSEV